MNYTPLQTKLIEFSIANAHCIEHNFRHFTYITQRNRVLSIGYNKPFKTHPKAKIYGHRFNCIHSELNAITNFPYAPYMLRKCRLINIRIGTDNTLRISKPCKYCHTMLQIFSFRAVLFSCDDGSFKEL